jgi:hypothetical protein
MRFYTRQHRHYCGIDLHARTMYLCILSHDGEILLERSLACDPKLFLRTIEPYREDLVVAVECIFTWYWLTTSGPSGTTGHRASISVWCGFREPDRYR